MFYSLLWNHSRFLCLKVSPRHSIAHKTHSFHERLSSNILEMVWTYHFWWSSHVVPATQFLFCSRNSPQLKLAVHSSDTVKWFTGQLLTGGFRVSSYTYLHINSHLATGSRTTRDIIYVEDLVIGRSHHYSLQWSSAPVSFTSTAITFIENRARNNNLSLQQVKEHIQ